MSKIAEFNDKLGARITQGVGTMWAAYAFAALTFLSLPSAIASHSLIVIVSWIAQTFLQLVLLSIIMVGQSVASKSVELKIDETHTASLAEFELAKEARANSAEEIKDLKAIMAAVHAKFDQLPDKN
jgi:hypothetical protein